MASYEDRIDGRSRREWNHFIHDRVFAFPPTWSHPGRFPPSSRYVLVGVFSLLPRQTDRKLLGEHPSLSHMASVPVSFEDDARATGTARPPPCMPVARTTLPGVAYPGPRRMETRCFVRVSIGNAMSGGGYTCATLEGHAG